MPLVGFRPTKARLVIEDGRESVLVMKVVLATEDAVELTGGGTLAALTGVLRIRERRNGTGQGGQPIGSMVYVAESGAEAGTGSARFQVNGAMAADKFAMLLRTASTGRLPTKFFVDAGEEVYEGQIVGETSREGDMVVNPLKGKKLTNIRTQSKDENVLLTPPIRMSLEQAMEYIGDDELVEVTPKNIRLRKRHLTEGDRKRAERSA